MPHDQTYLAHPLVLPNKSSSTLNLNNLLSIHGTNILGIPLPQCWFDNTRIDFPYYLYFKGTGKAYSFKINALNNFQAAILSGKLECLKVNACVERNNFSTKDVLEINTKLNEDYYLLIDQNNLSNFTLEFKEIPVTPINDSEKLIDFHGFKKENKILVAVNTNNNREFNIFVFDYSGKKCFERKFKKEISIPTEFLSSGLYLLVLVDLTNNNSLVKKISI